VVYDPVTQARAYPGYEYKESHRQFFLAWFRTPEEAQEATKAAVAGRQDVRLDAEYQGAMQRLVNVEHELRRKDQRGKKDPAAWDQLRRARRLLEDPARSVEKVREAMRAMAGNRK